MQNIHSAITQAVKGIGEQLAEIYGVSVARLYQILEADYYGKTRRLIRAIAAVDRERVRIIKADLDALFDELLSPARVAEVNAADLHAELNDVIHAKLKGLPRADRLRECREAVAILNDEIAHLEEAREIQEAYFTREARA